MEQTPRPPALALAAFVLAVVSAVTAGVLAVALVGLGALAEGGGGGALWLLGLVVAAVAQGWGAVRLLRRRGALLLALGTVPGVLPAVAFVGVYLEYGEGLSTIVGLAVAPVLTLLLVLTPPVRRWARGARDRGAATAPAG